MKFHWEMLIKKVERRFEGEKEGEFEGELKEGEGGYGTNEISVDRVFSSATVFAIVMQK